MQVGLLYSVESYVTLEKPINNLIEIPFGISYVSAALKQAGHETRLVVVTMDTDLKKVLADFVAHARPSMFCLTSVTTQMPIVTRAAKIIKELDPSIFIILGGAHATLNPEASISIEPIDAVCIGEGEAAAVKLAEQLEQGAHPADINNLWIKDRKTGAITKTPTNSFVDPLDSLPVADREMWVPWINGANIGIGTAVLLGRGCPYKCAYCSNHAISKISDGRYVRMRSAENVFSELRALLGKWPSTKQIYFEMETFGANVKWAIAFCDALEAFNRELSSTPIYGVNLAVTKKLGENEELLKAMQRANIRYVNVGLESGSERMRNEVLRRPRYTNDDIIAFSHNARKYRVDVNLYVLLGLPGESLADYMETVKCTRECQPHSCMVSIYFPYMGTDLYNMAKEMGLLKEESLKLEGERTTASFDLPGFSKRRIRFEYIIFYYRVYKGHWPATTIFFTVARSFIVGFPHLYHYWCKFSNTTAIGSWIKRLALSRNA